MEKTLYSREFEHDACGIGAVVSIDGIASHDIVDDALTIVERLEHRAGKDATGEVGDGGNVVFVLDLMDDAQGVLGVLRAAGAVGDGDEVGVEQAQAVEGAIDGFDGRVALGREDFEGKGASHRESLSFVGSGD